MAKNLNRVSDDLEIWHTKRFDGAQKKTLQWKLTNLLKLANLVKLFISLTIVAIIVLLLIQSLLFI